MHSSNQGPLFHRFAACASMLFFAVFFSGTAQALGTLEKITESGFITLGYRPISMPLSYLDGDKKPIGYSIDICMKIVNALRRELKRPKLAVKFHEVSSESRMNALMGGEIDLECGSSSMTAERLRQVAFSTPIFITAIRMIAREGRGITSISNLRGKTVVTTRGSTSEKLFADMNQLQSLGATLVLANNHADSFALLETGKADVFIMDDALVYSLRAASRDPARFVILRDSLAHEAIAIMLRKDDPAFKKVVDTEVNRLIAQGEMMKIYRKWFASPIPPRRLNLGMQPSYMLNAHFKSPGAWKVY